MTTNTVYLHSKAIICFNNKVYLCLMESLLLQFYGCYDRKARPSEICILKSDTEAVREARGVF